MARLLLVEDESAVRGLIRRMLESGGHEVTAAADGAEAFKLIEASAFDLVIADILLPDIDGMQLLNELRARRSSLKVIAISGGGFGSASDYLEMAQVLGAARTLQKPFSAPELLAAVAEVLAAA